MVRESDLITITFINVEMAKCINTNKYTLVMPLTCKMIGKPMFFLDSHLILVKVPYLRYGSYLCLYMNVCFLVILRSVPRLRSVCREISEAISEARIVACIASMTSEASLGLTGSGSGSNLVNSQSSALLNPATFHF